MQALLFRQLQPFLDHLRFEKRYSPHTLSAYCSDLTAFLDFLLLQYGDMELRAISPGMVRSWLAPLKEADQSSRSVNRRISTLKSFYRFLIKQGEVTASPLTTITAPKVRKRLPVYVEEQDLATLMQHEAFPATWEGRLHELVCLLFYSTGMRLSELTGLREQQLDLHRSQVKLLGKGNKERIIPLGGVLLQKLGAYLEARNQLTAAADTNVLLVRENGRPVYPRYIQRVIRQYLSLVTTVEKKSPHVLRHSFATHLMNNGAELNAVKELLGHSSLAATQVYTHNTIEKLKDIHKKAHPRG